MPNTARSTLAELRTALAEGWEIIQPIFARPLWASINDPAPAFNFVLQREQRMRLIIIPSDTAVEHFIREQKLAVDKS